MRSGADYEYEREFVVTSDTVITEKQARDATGIPTQGEAHPESTGARMHGKEADSLGHDGKSWMVRVHYRSRGASNVDQGDDPTDWTPQIEYYRVGMREAIDRAQFIGTNSNPQVEPNYLDPTKQVERPIVTTAGEAYEPIEIDKGYMGLSYSRWEASFNPVTALDYTDSVNQDVWPIPGVSPATSVQPGQARLMYWRASRRFQGTGLLYWVTYEFLFAVTHDLVLLNAGYFAALYDAAADTTALGRIVGGDGLPTAIPQLIDMEGDMIEPDGAVSQANPIDMSAALWNHYRYLKRRNFSALNLT